VAIVVQSVAAAILALTGSFVALALLSVVTRLLTYIATTAAVIVLRPRLRSRPGTIALPGGVAIPVAALGVSLALMAAATWAHLAAAGVAMAAGGVIYVFRRAPEPAGR
jgi:amino acid transporter